MPLKLKSVLIVFSIYVLIHLLFIPTLETDIGFEPVVSSQENVTITTRLSGDYSENGSRILNIVNLGPPYLLQVSVETEDKKYDYASVEQVIFIDPLTSKEMHLISNKELSKFKSYHDLPSVVGAGKRNVLLEQHDYISKIRIKLCSGEVCNKIELEDNIKFRVKKRFYSDTFANMMGI